MVMRYWLSSFCSILYGGYPPWAFFAALFSIMFSRRSKPIALRYSGVKSTVLIFLSSLIKQ
ncbi:Uncharacterised protein [Vibrio cholerae]|nr:Uncharacterised protein [Vibrio cholerae]